MTVNPILHMKCNPYPAYIYSGKVVYKKGDRHPERIFPAFVAMFIEAGTLYFTEDGCAYTLRPGQWFIQTPGVRHYGHQACEVRTVLHFVHFMPLGEWKIVNKQLMQDLMLSPVSVLDSGEGVRVPRMELEVPMRGEYPITTWRELFDQLEQEYAPGRGAIEKQARFLELLNRMMWLENEQETRNSQVQEVIAYIQLHYSEPLTVSEVAACFHFSPGYLTRQIKRITGMTPSELLNRYRMNKARHLLVQSHRSVQQIGCEVGYPDIAVFSRMFKRHAGVSPAQYRKQHWGKGGRS